MNDLLLLRVLCEVSVCAPIHRRLLTRRLIVVCTQTKLSSSHALSLIQHINTKRNRRQKIQMKCNVKMKRNVGREEKKKKSARRLEIYVILTSGSIWICAKVYSYSYSAIHLSVTNHTVSFVQQFSFLLLLDFIAICILWRIILYSFDIRLLYTFFVLHFIVPQSAFAFYKMKSHRQQSRNLFATNTTRTETQTISSSKPNSNTK